jgi:hypothetical protein
MIKRGWGAAQSRNKPDKIVDRYCISPQLAPPMVTPAEKKAFAASENYHEGRRK